MAGKRLAVAAAILMMGAEPALAHHSFQMFDLNKRVKVEGVVEEFQWTNPHTFVEVIATDSAGKQTKWSIETQATGVLRRRGWRANSLKPGDKITVEFSPLKTGENGGFLREIVKADGTVLNLGR